MGRSTLKVCPLHTRTQMPRDVLQPLQLLTIFRGALLVIDRRQKTRLRRVPVRSMAVSSASRNKVLRASPEGPGPKRERSDVVLLQ